VTDCSAVEKVNHCTHL